MGLESFNTENSYSGLKNNYDKEDLKDDDFNLGYIVGVLLCDGSIPSHRNRVQLQVSDKEFAKEFGMRLCNWLDDEWSGFNDDSTGVSATGPIETAGQDQWRIEKSSEDIVDVLSKYYDHDEWSEWITDFNKLGEMQMLRGMWDSEGSINETNYQVEFNNIEEGILSLYMYLVEQFIDVEFDIDNSEQELTEPTNFIEEANWEDMKSRVKSGDVAMTKRYETRARCILLPKSLTHEFYIKVEPTIERKCEVFKQW